MFDRHVKHKLSAYCHRELSPEEGRRVAEHLSSCPACRKELEEIKFGIHLAENLPLAAAPEPLWNSLETALDKLSPVAFTARLRFSGAPWPRVSVAIAFLLLVAVGIGWYLGIRERLHLTLTAAAPSKFEAAAIEAHNRRLQGQMEWDLGSSAPRQLRDWLQARSGLDAHIPDERPLEDEGRLRILGVKLIIAAGAPAAVVGYEVNSQPVTLVTARLRDLPQPPKEGFLSKDIVYRLDRASGHKVLNWGADGQAYVIISDLPGFGQQGCFLCHTTPERRDLIRNIRPQHTN